MHYAFFLRRYHAKIAHSNSYLLQKPCFLLFFIKNEQRQPFVFTQIAAFNYTMYAFLFFVYIAQKQFLFFYTYNNFLTDTIFFDRCKLMFAFCKVQKREKKQKNRKNRVFLLYFLQICIFCKHFSRFAERRSFSIFPLQRKKKKSAGGE